MNSLNNKDVFLPQLEKIAFIFSLPGLEVKHRKFYSLSIKKCQHIFVELLHINGFQTLIILFPEFIQRGMLCLQNNCQQQWDVASFHVPPAE